MLNSVQVRRSEVIVWLAAKVFHSICGTKEMPRNELISGEQILIAALADP